jgi:hypothetical protein
MGVSKVAGPRPSNCLTTAVSAARPIQNPPPRCLWHSGISSDEKNKEYTFD